MVRPDESLEELANLYRQRNQLYGDNYKNFGNVVSSLFPDGIHVDGASNINRLSVLFHIIDKVTRYIANFNDGGHEDSLDDISVYSQMLKELDNDQRAIQTGHEKGNS
jgi:hypothetical protein|tara:strand:- start:41 stop:364 length:324 start_codon:yes stop_codon:yes gene_type:complete